MAGAIVESGYWPAGKSRRLPAHRNAGLEIVLVTRGQVLWQVEGHAETVPAGSAFFTFPWETHGSLLEQEPGCELYFVVLSLDRRQQHPARRFGLHRSLGLSPSLTRDLCRDLLAAPRRTWPGTDGLCTYLPALVHEHQPPGPSGDVATALARLVVCELHRSLRGGAKSRARPAAETRVRQFVDRLADECHRPWTLDTMAAACNLGRTRFTVLLKQLTGDRPTMAVNRARIARARRLLTTTGTAITQIAHDCGFASSQYFCDVFRAYTDSSPRAYRAAFARANPFPSAR